jgi:hypothetical protein
VLTFGLCLRISPSRATILTRPSEWTSKSSYDWSYQVVFECGCRRVGAVSMPITGAAVLLAKPYRLNMSRDKRWTLSDDRCNSELRDSQRDESKCETPKECKRMGENLVTAACVLFVDSLSSVTPLLAPFLTISRPFKRRNRINFLHFTFHRIYGGSKRGSVNQVRGNILQTFS